jgi:hypothetical protein
MKNYVGECKGNDGGGCFLDSCGHDCGCFTVEESKKQQKYDEMLAMLEKIIDIEQGAPTLKEIEQLIKEAKEL